MTGDDNTMLPAGLLAPAHARAWLTERSERIPSAVYEDTLLVASELVTNAIRHGEPDIVLSLRLIPRGVRVAVADAGAQLPVLPAGTPDLDRPSGRGLVIVAATAYAWGVEAHPAGSGKTVWAELAGD